MADTTFAMFAVHSRKQRASIIFRRQQVLVRTEGMEVSFKNPAPQRGRPRWLPCKKHARLLASLASKAIKEKRIEQEQADLARLKDRAFA